MVNYQHKDRLFRALFGSEGNKENLLSLYNALNGTDYTDTEDLEIYTIDDVIYMGMKNDVSCIIDNCLSLYEHQSTFNPNMPLRGLMYFGKMYNGYIKVKKKNIYSQYLVKIPVPQYYVFYNGNEELEERMNLKLSNAFEIPLKEGGFEWTAVMLNINYGKNKELMKKCRPLRDYSIFIGEVKDNNSHGMPIHEAINQAVKDCIKENIMADYLLKHKAEVMDMCLTEYNEQETWAAIAAEEREHAREEARKEWHKKGLEEGRMKGRMETAKKMAVKLYEDNVPLELIAKYTEESIETIRIWLEIDNV